MTAAKYYTRKGEARHAEYLRVAHAIQLGQPVTPQEVAPFFGLLASDGFYCKLERLYPAAWRWYCRYGIVDLSRPVTFAECFPGEGQP